MGVWGCGVLEIWGSWQSDVLVLVSFLASQICFRFSRTVDVPPKYRRPGQNLGVLGHRSSFWLLSFCFSCPIAQVTEVNHRI